MSAQSFETPKFRYGLQYIDDTRRSHNHIEPDLGEAGMRPGTHADGDMQEIPWFRQVVRVRCAATDVQVRAVVRQRLADDWRHHGVSRRVHTCIPIRPVHPGNRGTGAATGFASPAYDSQPTHAYR